MLPTFQSGSSPQHLLIIITLINSISLVSSTPAFANLPYNATWSPNATTVAGQASGTSGSSTSSLNQALGISISTNDVLYIADCKNNRVIMTNLTSSTVKVAIGTGKGGGATQFYCPEDVFVTGTYLYVLDVDNNRVQNWTTSGTSPSTVSITSSFQFGFFMFIDKNKNLYALTSDNTKVVYFAPGSINPVTAAGGSSTGSQANRLDNPQGIFVDNSLTLFIADQNNHRVQMWTYGASSGSTVAGNGNLGSSLQQLNYPSSVVVDTYGFIYVADTRNNRIVRWTVSATSGICVVGCIAGSGKQPYQLDWPVTFAFDSNGSLYVSDFYNYRVQKFQILNKPDVIQTTMPTTVKAMLKTTQITSTKFIPVAESTLKIITTTQRSLLTSNQPTTKGQFISTSTLPSIKDSTSMEYSTLSSQLKSTSSISSTAKHIETSYYSSTFTTHPQTISSSTTARPSTLAPTSSISPTTTLRLIDTSKMASTYLPTTKKSLTTIELTPTTSISRTSSTPIFTSSQRQSPLLSSIPTTVIQAITVSSSTFPMSPTTISRSIATSKMTSSYLPTTQKPLTTVELEPTTSISKISSTSIAPGNQRQSPLLSSASTTMIQMTTVFSLTFSISSTTMSQSIDTAKMTFTSSLATQKPLTTVGLKPTTSISKASSAFIFTSNQRQSSLSSLILPRIIQTTAMPSSTFAPISWINPRTTSRLIATSQMPITSPETSSMKSISSFLSMITTSKSPSVDRGQTSQLLTSIVVETQTKPPSTTISKTSINDVKFTTSLSTAIKMTITATLGETTSLPPLTISRRSSTVDVKQTSVSSLTSIVTKPQSMATSVETKHQTSLLQLLSTSTFMQQPTEAAKTSYLHPMVTSSSSTTMQNSSRQNCSYITISLWPTNPISTIPLQIERNDDLSISSTLQYHCPQVLAVTVQWSFALCFNSSCLSKTQFIPSSVQLSLAELYLPPNTFNYGIYQITLTVKTGLSFTLISSAVTYVKIVPSSIEVNLLMYGPSIITLGQQETLVLDPGRFSVDPDQTVFNSSNWNYTYLCGIDSVPYSFNTNDTMFSIEDSVLGSCFPNSAGNQSLWNYGLNYSQSSLVIHPGSFHLNQTYHFRVYLTNIEDPSRIFTDDLLVQIVVNQTMTIIVKCTISGICIPNNQYEIINPTTQIALTSFCLPNCSSDVTIQWNIFYGIMNSTDNIVQWTLLDNATEYNNLWIFGLNWNDLTMTKEMLLMYSSINYWRFEVIYSVGSVESRGVIQFLMNSPPSNGTCSISPSNGTTTTLFTITCLNWFDEHGIEDYSFYTWTSDSSNRLMLAYNASGILQVRMPIGDLTSTLLHVSLRVRDRFNCVSEMSLTTVSVIPDVPIPLTTATLNPSDIQILYGGNQNDVCQTLTTLSQILNILAARNLPNNQSSLIRVSISPLIANSIAVNNMSWISNYNTTDYNQQLNSFAAVEEYLMVFIQNLTIAQIDSVILQSSTLSQLTATTNQLTRDALIIASTRCLELSRALSESAASLPFEDVLLAIDYLAQCDSNVLTTVYGPIQERTIVLDLDTNRANALPSDYDTNMEAIWSNLNLFASGDDFSQATIDRNRNLYYQQQTAQLIEQQFEEMLSMITNALSLHLNVEQSVQFASSSITLFLKKTISANWSKQIIRLDNQTQIILPANLHFNLTRNTTILYRCVQTPLPMVGNNIQTYLNLSRLLSITFLDENNDEISVQTTMDNPVQFFISRDPNTLIPSMYLQNVSSSLGHSSMNNQQFNLHFLNITPPSPNISLSVHIEFYPLNDTLGYLLIYKFDGIPQLNSSMNNIDGWTILCPQNLSVYFIDNEKTLGHQSMIFGIRELNAEEFSISCVNESSELPITDQPFQFSSNYALRIFTSGCYYLDSNNNWQSTGLLVGSLTDYNRTQCFSTHLSTFASGFVVLPNPINWNYVFSHGDFLKNKTIYLTVLVIIIFFIIFLIYARRLDQKDDQKIDVTVLPKHQQNEEYYYQIVVFTGIRKDAGTKAKVFFVLSGDEHQTDARALTNPHRAILQRESIDSFLFAVPKSLGLLNYLHIWHDNSGRGSSSSWFLKYIIVRDLQTMEKSYFICQQWFAVDKDDGKIERVLPVSNPDQMRELVYPFMQKVYYDLSDDHLWFSIFSRPLTTEFTHIQRCVCCFVLLFTSMLLNILYYDQVQQAKDDENIDGFSLGPMYFTKEQIIIGIIVDVLTFIPSALLVAFFRHIRQHRSSRRVSPTIDVLTRLVATQTLAEESAVKKKKKKKGVLLPWWCLFIAYGLSVLLIGISIVLIIARGIEFGDAKTQKWLASIVTSFFSSILLSQPIKVLGMAILVSIFNFSLKNAEEQSDDYVHKIEEFYLNAGEKDVYATENHGYHRDGNSSSIPRLNKTQVLEARSNRLQVKQMRSSIRYLFIYSVYLAILYVVSYINRNNHSYEQVAHLRNFFLNPSNATHNYLKISSIDQYWQWLEESFVDNIRAQSWYNGDPPQYLSGFVNDRTNRLVGWPMMRQLRVKPNSTCQVPEQFHSIISRCLGDYTSRNEDRQSYFPGWQSEKNTSISYSSAIENAFVYQSAEAIYTGIAKAYDSGGYTYEFRGSLMQMQGNLSNLRQLSWIDSQTRAVIIEMTLYNDNVQLLTSLIFLVEFLSSGDILTQARFDPIDFHARSQGDLSSTVHNICAIIYMIFICYFTMMETRSVIKLKKKYFDSRWIFIQWGTIVSSWTGLGIYMWRLRETSRIDQFIHMSKGYDYLDLQTAVYTDNVLTFLFGFCCFFGTIQYLHFVRFNSRLSQFVRTFRYIQKDLFYFAWIFALIFIAFLSLFYLLFHTKLLSCSNPSRTAEMLLEMLLLKFDSQDLYAADAFLGPFAFTLFIYFVVFICCTMIIAIINDGFRRIRLEKTSTENDVLLFILSKIKNAFGIKKKIETMDIPRDLHPIEQLANRLDQLAIILNKLEISDKQ